MKSLFSTLFCFFFITIAHAGIDLRTTIRYVYQEGTEEIIGLIDMVVHGNDFSSNAGSVVDPDHPVYIRIKLDKGVILASTLVDPTLDSPPINLGVRVEDTTHTGIASAMAPTDIQLIRAIQGERSIWVRVNRASDTWLDSDGDGIGDSAPSAETRVVFTIGDVAGIYNPANTQLRVDVTGGGCLTWGFRELLTIDPTAHTFDGAPGSPGSPEAASYEAVDPETCTFSGGVDTEKLQLAPIFFSADRETGLVTDEPLVGLEIFGPDSGYANQSLSFIANPFGHTKKAAIHWDFGDDRKGKDDILELNTYFNYTFTEPGVYQLNATITNEEGYSSKATKFIDIVEPPEVGAGKSYLPHLTREHAGFETEIIIENDSFEAKAYRVLGYNDMGELIHEVDRTIAAATQGPRSELVDSDDLLSEATVHAEIQGDVDVKIAYRRADGLGSRGHAAATIAPASKWKFRIGDAVAVWDGLALVNHGEQATQITVKQFNSDGTFLGQVVLNSELQPKAKMIFVMDPQQFDLSPNNLFIIESTQAPVLVTALRGDKNTQLFWQNPVQSVETP